MNFPWTPRIVSDGDSYAIKKGWLFPKFMSFSIILNVGGSPEILFLYFAGPQIKP